MKAWIGVDVQTVWIIDNVDCHALVLTCKLYITVRVITADTKGFGMATVWVFPDMICCIERWKPSWVAAGVQQLL